MCKFRYSFAMLAFRPAPHPVVATDRTLPNLHTDVKPGVIQPLSEVR